MYISNAMDMLQLVYLNLVLFYIEKCEVTVVKEEIPHDSRPGQDNHYHQMALQPGVGLGLRYNMPPGLSVPCSIWPFVYTHLSQVHGHVIQPSHSWSSSSSCCVQPSVQHLFWDFGVLHSFYMPKPSYSLAFNKPDNVLSLDYGF